MPWKNQGGGPWGSGPKGPWGSGPQSVGPRPPDLEDLFVRPAHRGKGIGEALLAQLADHCIANGWARLQWAVLDWNTPSIEFYKSLGAELMNEWTGCRLDGPALAALARGWR